MILFLVNFLMGATALCTAQLDQERTLTLSIDGKFLKVGAMNPDAKLVKCEQNSKFPKLYLAEIFMGISGTSRLASRTNLVIVDTSGKSLKKVLEKTIHRSIEMLDEETGENIKEDEPHTYSITADKKGRPQLQLDQEKPILLK